MMTTLNTSFARYHVLRMPFGIHSAQDVFQRMVGKTYGDLPGVAVIIDDILIDRETKEEHDNNLRAVLLRSREREVTLNPEKLAFRTKVVSYFGNLIKSEAVKPNPNRISATMNMPQPENKMELKTLLGKVDYLAKFSSQLPETMTPVGKMLKDNVRIERGYNRKEHSLRCNRQLQIQRHWHILTLRRK